MVRKISKTKTAQLLHPSPPVDGNSFRVCGSVYINYSKFYNTIMHEFCSYCKILLVPQLQVSGWTAPCSRWVLMERQSSEETRSAAAPEQTHIQCRFGILLDACALWSCCGQLPARSDMRHNRFTLIILLLGLWGARNVIDGEIQFIA